MDGAVQKLARVTPIFDTNIFGHLQDGSISQDRWRRLLKHRPRYGWPLSNVTALELLSGLHDIPEERFPSLRSQIDFAFKLSRGRILEDPKFLLCTELLRAHFPTKLVPPLAKRVTHYMDIVRRAQTVNEIKNCRVRYKNDRVGFPDTSVLKDLMDGPRKQWTGHIEAIATENYPQWRELFAETRRRLPLEMRKELKRPSAWNVHRERHARTMLEWLEIVPTDGTVTDMANRLDASFEFSTFVAREFLVRDYSLEKRSSDVFDFFQLHYLGMDKYVIVSDDADLTKRTSRSPQAGRIMSFDAFMASL